MGKQASRCGALFALLSLAVLPGGAFSPRPERVPVGEELFWEADFASVISQLERRGTGSLPPEEELLEVECLARTGRGEAALMRLERFPSMGQEDVPALLRSRISATAGVVLFSLGRMEEARNRILEALAADPASERALLALIYLALHDRAPAEAARRYDELIKAHPVRDQSYLLYLVGLEVRSASRDPKRLAELYRSRAGLAGKESKAYAEGLRTNARLAERALREGFYNVTGTAEKQVIPFAPARKDQRPNVILLETKAGRFRMLVDSGNRAGWTVLNPELLDVLRSSRGGRVLSEIGTQAGFLEGYAVFTPALELATLTLRGLTGFYVPKPHPGFYDAILNPAAVGDRVVTLDFAAGRLILRTKGRFEKDLAAEPQGRLERFPWHGFGHAFVQAEADGAPALTLLETGAEDIAIRLDYARRRGLPLAERRLYLASGKEMPYHLAPLRLSLGSFLFVRQEAEVWPLSRLAHPITGLTPDVMIGPMALAGAYSLSFDPFADQIVLQRDQ